MKTWLTSCVWVDEEGALHISIPHMLDQLGVADTPANRERCQEVALHILEDLLKDHPAVIKITK